MPPLSLPHSLLSLFSLWLVVMAVGTLLLLVSHAAVLARLHRVVLDRVQLDVLDRVAERAAAAVAHRDVAVHLDHWELRNALLRVAAVAVNVLLHASS